MSKFISFIKTPKGLIIITAIVLVIVIIIAYNWDKIAGLFSSKPTKRIINPNPKVYLTDCVNGYETVNGLQGSRRCKDNGDGTYSYL